MNLIDDDELICHREQYFDGDWICLAGRVDCKWNDSDNICFHEGEDQYPLDEEEE